MWFLVCKSDVRCLSWYTFLFFLKHKTNDQEQSRYNDFVTFDPKEAKADGRKRQKSEAESEEESSSSPAVKNRKIEKKTVKKRGVFDNARRVALLEAYVMYRPDGVPYKERSNSWMKITEKVNLVDDDTDVAKQTAQNEFKRLMSEYGPVLDRKVQEMASGINRYSTEVEAAARKAYEKVKLYPSVHN